MSLENNARPPVSRHKAIFSAPPEHVPAGGVDVSGNGRWRIWEFAGTKIDAPLLGNGDMLSAFAGPTNWPQFWVTTNDFWQMESNPNYEFFHDNAVAKYDPPVAVGSPRPLGRLVFDIPTFENAAYHAEQDFLTATTEAALTAAGGDTVKIRSWVAALENVLVVELEATRDTEVSCCFLFPDELGKGCDKGVDFDGGGESDERLAGTFVGLIGGKPLQYQKKTRGCAITGYRSFEDHVDVPTKLGFAGKFLDCDADKITVKKGETATFVLPVRSWDKVSRPYEYACSRARSMTADDVAALRAAHLLWWREYWAASSVELDDKLLEQRYYLSQYVMGSMSRDPDYPPNILGISTFDRMAWNGNYKINYNHQSPYLGLLASGHFEQSDPHDAPYFSMLDICREMSRRLLGHPGAYLPLGLGPKGMVSEALLLHMKSPAVHGATNMILRYFLTLDKNYALRVYSFLKAVADFWEHDLVRKDGKYRIVGDGMHEKTTGDVNASGMPENPVNSLGYLKMFFSAMPKISADLGLDAEKRALWNEIAENLSDYPTATITEIGANYPSWRGKVLNLTELLPQELHDKRVFLNEEVGSTWTQGFPANVMHVYPAGAVGLDSPADLLNTARNTIWARSEQEKALFRMEAAPTAKQRSRKTGAWNDGNLSCLFFPAAVRCGFDPETIVNELRARITDVGLPNGFIYGNPHGIENLSTVPNTLQEMMLLSHENIIRLFRVFPREMIPNASFKNLWAFGAFKVSADLRGGAVTSCTILSIAGRDCTLENPWPGKAVRIRSNMRKDDLVLAGDRVSFTTLEGERLEILPE